MSAMEKAGIKKLSIKEKTGYEIHLERHEEHSHAPAAMAVPAQHHASFFAHPLAKAVEAPMHAAVREEFIDAKAVAPQVEGKSITSPMVGTYYIAPSPDDPPFIKVGDRVEENTVVCIIEAMKVMNEVKSGMSGVVAEMCVENGHPVEFGTKLFRIV